MNHNIFAFIISLIFLVAGVVFVVKQEWLFAVLFIAIGGIYLVKAMNKDKSNGS
ncbi:hypothetical protein [Staphylococcus americanisciuri]|uniref:Uncharacterized protein n=1 Tax=Staphylococcus americanisciuri TaxID=2973940 RepID=A0ABT2F319_9STAP|nr:hypothetical protein [Staphylococcus americanisciuri]MCS4486802.1 hypothetical protein [Staphylococcus americanisciuri]